VARSAVRPQDSLPSNLDPVGPTGTGDDVHSSESVAYDVARSAVRMGGEKQVHVVCLENRKQMPADEIEVTEGAEEGLVLHNSRGPREIVGENGKVTGLRTVECAAVFDANGRFNPTFNEQNVEDIAADTIIFSIGQSSDLSFLSRATELNRIAASSRSIPRPTRPPLPMSLPAATLRTARACSSMPSAPRKSQLAPCTTSCAARAPKKPFALPGRRPPTPCATAGTSCAAIIRRLRMHPSAPFFLQVIEAAYPTDAARTQAARCLRCNVNTVFDTGMCVACTGCVDICPENLIVSRPR
jgi:formate dehydrogenase beta subunit